MPPCRSIRRVGNTPRAQPPPTPYVVSAAFHAVMATAISQLSTNGTNGNGNSTNSSNHGNRHGYRRGWSYKDFSNCKPKPFYGNRGVIDLTRWFENTESVFKIHLFPKESKVMFVACTFVDGALSWWNGHVKSLPLPMANCMSWKDLKNMMLEEYNLRGEVHKLE